MLNEKQNNNLTFIASRIYDDFNNNWGINSNKISWVSDWADYLDVWSLEPKTPLKAFNFCINNLDYCPSLPEFSQYCEFINSGEILN